ncbi:MAG TPA: hypothetical protein VGN57_09295 [Pirellulaceae bacterium]|nr:hypothetical protein [Pirellulaceae bacterium]
MSTLRGILLLSATITGNLIVACAVRQGLLALGANDFVAGAVATTVWSVVAFSMLTSIAVRFNRRFSRAASAEANSSAARPFPTIPDARSLAR